MVLHGQARLDILKIHSRKMNLTRGINLRKIAELMPGASGAEVKVSVCCIIYVGSVLLYTQKPSWDVWYVSQGVCTEAGMYALRERRVHVTQEDFEMAVAKVGASVSLPPTVLPVFCLLKCSFVVLPGDAERQ